MTAEGAQRAFEAALAESWGYAVNPTAEASTQALMRGHQVLPGSRYFLFGNASQKELRGYAAWIEARRRTSRRRSSIVTSSVRD